VCVCVRGVGVRVCVGCVWVCECVCVRCVGGVCVCVCVCVGECVFVCGCGVCVVCVVSAIQHAKRKRHIVICGLSGSTTFFPHSLTKDKTFGKKYRIQNVCFDFLHNFCSKNLSFQEKCRAIS